MQFTTKIPIHRADFPLDYGSTVFSLGSCFAVNISEKFDYFQFRNTVNPFGILFHPVAIENFIRFAVNEKRFTENDIFFHNERWQCFDAHSDVSHSDKHQLLQNLNSQIEIADAGIKEATHIIITLGTAWAYRNVASKNLVANCHKVPQKQFDKELLSVDVITQSLRNTIALLRQANASVQIIFTVSPVRHIKDGFVENQWSKSNLIAALHQTIASSTSVDYFPSYEIMMDELRDYRFYSEDMLHPNQTAIDYIWERFVESWISTSALLTMEEVSAVRKGLAHRPFHPHSHNHKQFLASIQAQANTLIANFPHMRF